MTFETTINSQQVEYFRRRLLTWRDQLATESAGMGLDDGKATSIDFKGQAANATNDSTSSQSPHDREQKLIHKIDTALKQVEAGTYGV